MSFVVDVQKSKVQIFHYKFVFLIKQTKESTKMTQCGYDKQRFPNLQGEMFDCLICQCVVKDPKECNSCGNMFCGACIDDWLKRNNNCPNRCVSNIHPMSSGALKRIYNALEIRCKSCNKIISLCELQSHEKNCGKTRCWNEAICSNYDNPQFKHTKPCCSQRCQFLLKLIETGGSAKQMYNLLKDFKLVSLPLSSSTKVLSSNNLPPNTNNNDLKWDNIHYGTGVVFENNRTLVFLKEQSYVFRSVVTQTGFTGGIHYWEIIADNRTENQLKIGVTTSNSFDFNTAFCDHAFGWAFYGLGQLRHHSNASGPQYGKRFKKDGILGVYLNMNKGTLAFALNGELMGVAYTDNGLTKGPIYPAVSLLHCAGCIIKGQLPVPGIFNGL